MIANSKCQKGNDTNQKDNPNMCKEVSNMKTYIVRYYLTYSSKSSTDKEVKEFKYTCNIVKLLQIIAGQRRLFSQVNGAAVGYKIMNWDNEDEYKFNIMLEERLLDIYRTTMDILYDVEEWEASEASMLKCNPKYSGESAKKTTENIKNIKNLMQNMLNIEGPKMHYAKDIYPLPHRLLISDKDLYQANNAKIKELKNKSNS